jgi:F5/8 type C domain-containing protein
VLAEDQWLLIDFLTNREYRGIVIDWDPEDYATAYEVQISEDGAYWKLAYTGTGSNGGRDYIYMPNVESCYLRLELKQSSRGRGYGIRTIYVEPGASTLYTRYQLQNPEAQPHTKLQFMKY